MQTRINKSIAIFGFILIATVSPGQDFHLSQYDAHPLWINPALTGLRMDGDWNYRININYREQWDEFLDRPYGTVAAGFDIPTKGNFSVGEFITNNSGPDGSFNTFNLMLSGAYKLTHKDAANRHHLAVGLQLGVMQKSFNHGNFTYDSQYSPSALDGFDENLPSGENFRRENIFSPDANVGFYYRIIDGDIKFSPFIGASVYHLLQPNESFIGGESQSPMNIKLLAGLYCRVNEGIRILPQVLYMEQAKVSVTNLGILAFFKMQDTGYEPMLGIAWRNNKDAVILHLGLKNKNTTFRASYDLNTSYLKAYSKGKGGLEFSIIYTGKRKSTDAPVNALPKEGEKGIQKQE